MLLIVVKVIVTIIVVILLAEISKRVGPAVGGILFCLPLGARLIFYFIAYEQGIDFMIQAIPWGIVGLSLTLVFSFVYLMTGASLRSTNVLKKFVLSSLAAVATYCVCALIVRRVELRLVTSLLITASFILLNLVFLSKLRIVRNARGQKEMSLKLLLFRAITAGLLVTLISGAARLVGSEWSGIFSAFPTMLLPLLLILHYEEDDRLYPGVIYGYAFSVTNLLIFYVTAWLLLPRLTLNLSFVIIYLISAVYLWLLNKLKDVYLKHIRID